MPIPTFTPEQKARAKAEKLWLFKCSLDGYAAKDAKIECAMLLDKELADKIWEVIKQAAERGKNRRRT